MIVTPHLYPSFESKSELFVLSRQSVDVFVCSVLRHPKIATAQVGFATQPSKNSTNGISARRADPKPLRGQMAAMPGKVDIKIEKERVHIYIESAKRN